MERCKYRHVAEGFRQVPVMDFTEKSALAPGATCTRVLLTMGEVNSTERHHINVVQTFIHASIYEDIYIDLLEKYQNF